ncbi:23S rRNA (adenine(2503)-C(2))-methyltransferase RlmN [Botrimarina sp.]|uniref:23S rRNA (adenine(2503)-C(2))-methyltransferase RlmN n=1 Tax=Botrimarina sp. TaxID=2795802 RepID=UPI0032EB901C
MSAQPVSFYDKAAIDGLAARSKIDPHRVRRARTAFFKRALGSEATLAELPERVRPEWRERVAFHPLALARRHASRVDEAQKLVFRTGAGFSIESVLMQPKTGRVALCISSQVGCAAACRFCATGQMGVAKSLSPGEIAAQVAAANELLRGSGRRVRNVVFMGMGEPMHNAAAVRKTLGALTDPAMFDYSPARILLSTVGAPAPWIETVRAYPGVNYALSLHSAVDSTRRQIIPLAAKHGLAELRDAVRAVNELQPERRAVMIEYLVLEGLTDSTSDADALIGWLDGLRVHVNLIPYNPVAGAPDLRRAPRDVTERFGARVKAAGYPTTIRYSMGQDIDAACGQLVRDENRAVQAELATALLRH